MQWSSDSDDDALPYRRAVRTELATWRIVVGESDLAISSVREERERAEALLRRLRSQLQEFASLWPPFLVSLEPVEPPPDIPVPAIVAPMLAAGKAAGVGPFAAVAGAIAEETARFLAQTQAEVIVENGGDIFVISSRRRICGVYAGPSPFSLRLGIALEPRLFPCGIGTSSGSVGPSLSLGKADAAVVVADSGALADAFATALANRIRRSSDLRAAVQWALRQDGVKGALAIAGDTLAVQGELELVQCDP